MGRVLQFPIVATLLLAGWGAEGVSGQGQAGAGSAPPASESRLEPAAFEALFHARADSARMRFTEADVHFIEMMIPHHLQALEMSALAPERTANPEILTLAARIFGGQSEEIARMQKWLRDRGIAEPAGHTGMPASPQDDAHQAHMASGTMDEGSMPGLLSPEQMEVLADTRGEHFDLLFLSFMIQHHQGAIQMVEDLFSTEGAAKDGDFFRMASDIRVDQATEVSRMERMLALLTLDLHLP